MKDKKLDGRHGQHPNPVLVLCSYPQAGGADALARALLERRLASSVNILPAGQSLFRWDEQIKCAQEQLLLIKTLAPAYASVESLIREHHPYELPAILCVPIATGHLPYMDWIRAMVSVSA